VSARHRAEPIVAPALKFGGITGGMDGAPSVHGFECPHCGMYDPSIQQTVKVTAFLDALPDDGHTYRFGDATSADPVEHVEYRCNHCLEEVTIDSRDVRSRRFL
jgi:DNA-directed RNA polymerase subunit RPC12/RpoP